MKTKLVASLVKSSSTALSALLLALSALTASALPIITNVIETGGDNEATDTVTAKWTGVTFSNGIDGEFLKPFLVPRFAEEVPAMVDRVHQWNGVATNLPLPSYLVGGEYIMIGNDNRDNNPFKLDVTVSVPSIVFLLVDNRQGDADNATPPQAGRPLSGWTNMTWVGTSGFVPVMNGLNRTASRAVPDEVGYDEGGDAVGPGGSIQTAASVYVKSVPAGTFTLLQADNAGQNMYGVVVKAASDPSAQANLPAEFGQTVNGFQDSFDGATLNASWKARGPSTNIYSLANGILSVTNAVGDPNHLLYEAAGYNSTNQEVLARIRINRFGTNDLARAGVGVGVGTTNSQGINYHFRNEGAGGVHTEFLDDARQWGPELSFKWQTNVWYWMRLKHEPNTATNIDAFAKVWVADGLTPEPVDWQSTWNYVTTGASPTVRSGFAGITAGSAFDGTAATAAVFDVDYILIKAAGLPSIVAGASTPADTKIQILGLGAAALLGGPLTDPDGNGLDALGGATSSTWDWAGITSSHEPDFEGGENAFNIFDHKVGGGNDKWCCDDPTPGKPVWVSVQFRQAVSLTHFTVASGNDTPTRDPTDWAIQGSNDGITFSDIYHFFGITTPWTDRNQVVKFTLPAPAQAYRHIRYIAYDTPATLHQLNEIEYFGTLVAATSLTLVQDPANTTVLESGTSTATFTANADGPKPITYQWLKNGVEIPGATNRSLTLNVNAGDSGAAISVRASDGTATVTSKTGTLTVTPDKAPPTVLSAATKGDPNTVTVVFSEAVSQATALNLANFSINNGALITDFAFGANASTLVLKTTTLSSEKSYTLFVSDVADRAFVPNRITPNPTSIPINNLLGSLLVETFTGLGGTAVSDLLTAGKFLTNAVDLTTFITNFNYSPNLDNYGARISGYFIAPSNGVYRFFTRSDDASQLFMNTNNASSTDPAGKVLIAQEPGCCNAYLATGTQTSVGIAMNGGQRYYIEGLLKEGGGGDYLQVAFRESAVTTVPAVTEFIASQFLAAPSGPVQLSQQPLSLTVTELQGAKFSVVVQGAFPYSYQWKLNGVAIAGATGSSLSIASTALTQNGNVYSVEVKNAFSSVTSSNATLTVTPDIAGPLLVSAVGSGSLTEMTLNFNEPVNLYSYPVLAPGKVNLTLTGAAQRPTPATNTASGSGALSLNGNQLSFNITYQGLSGVATAFHFHAPATTEQAAGVVISLVPFSVGALGTNGSIVGTVTLTTEQLNWLAGGLIYVNIHTAANPGGEIRGQLPIPTSPVVTIPGLTVTGTKAGADGKSIVVSTSAQEAGTSYTAGVTGVKDRAVAANAVAADSFASFTGWVSSTGYLVRQVYTGIGGGTVADLTGSSKFPNSPDVTELVSSFEAPTGYADNYGQKVSGFVTAPETGNYTFFLSADDNAALYLSTDENAANKKLIAIETAWSNSREWVVSGGSSVLASKRSDQFAASEWPSKTNITLTAGKRYYVEALQKEGGGGDNLGVTWKLPSQATAPTNGAPTIAGTFLSSAANPEVASITITKHPVSTTVTEGIGITATFEVDATAKIGAATNQPVLIQWAKNGEVIAGANGKSYTTPQVTLANDQDLYVALVSVPGKQLFSRGAVLTVLGDTTAPMVVSANSYTRPGNVTVVFSEPVSKATATDLANYKISNGTAVTGAVLTNPNTVELSLAVPAVPGNAVTVTAFDFDEGTGSTTTSKDGKLVGAFNGATFSTDSPSGAKGDSSIQFGAGQKITVPDPSKVLAINSPDTSFTVQAWLKIPNQSDARSVFFYNQGPGGRISASITSTNVPGGVSQSHAGFVTTLGILDVPSKALFPVDNKWHHMAVVHENGKELRFYIDGALGDTVPYTRGVSFAATEKEFYFGSEPTGGLQYLGLLDRFKLSKGIVPVGELDSKAVRPPTIVTNLLVSINNTNQLWSYENTAKDLGTTWKDKAFNDSAWPKGAAILGVNSDNTHTNFGPIRTPLVRANGATSIITDYFRTHFNFSGNPAATKLSIDLAVDDGAVLYLNGTEIYRFGVTNGQTFNSTTLFSDHEANLAVNALGQPASVTDLSGAALVAGDNVLAVEVHQLNATSSDVVLGVNLTALTDTAVIQAPAASPLANGLVAYWNFDGNLLDSANGSHGTARGSTPLTYVDGKGGFGKAAQFNGTNYVEITGSSNTLQFAKGSLSIAGWFRVDAFDKGWQALLSKGEGTSYRVARRDDGNKNNIGYAGGVGEGANDVPNITNGWHHFVAVTDATGAKFGTALYVDGVIYGINTNKAVLDAGTLNLLIGENPGALNRQFKGALDDIALWNRVLTAAEVSMLYNGGTGTPLGKIVTPVKVQVLGIGAAALLGGPLTDPDGNGLDALGGASSPTWDWAGITSSHEPDFEGGENSFNIFDHKVGGGNDKWCCDDPTPGKPVWVAVQFRRSVSLTHFTVTSGNDTPGRDPTDWAIQGSSDGVNYTDIYHFIGSTTPWGDVRNEVVKFTLPSAAPAYPYIRYIAYETPANLHQLNEIEYFGTITAPPQDPLAGLTLAVTGIKDGATKPNTIAANTVIPINTNPALPIDFSQIVNGFQDDFNGTVLNPNWKARGPSTNIYSVANGMLSVGNAAGDPNHLLYEASGYNRTNQEVLARIRITDFGNTDASRAGIGAGVGTNSQGINLHFRNNTQNGVVGKQFKFLDDNSAWGPAGLKIEWDNNKWYWMRLKHAPNTATAQVDVFGKVWAADGVTQEPADYQMLWDRYPAATTRSGFAGITAGSIFVSTNAATSAAFDVDYILIKADGLPSIKPSGSSVAPISTGTDTLETVENTPVNVSSEKLLANDSGAGGSLSLIGVSAASSAGGSVKLGGTTVTYTPKTGFKGEDSFTYTVAGSTGPSATGKVVVTVLAGSAPSQNVVAIIKSDAGPVIAQFVGIPNRTYKVQASNDLAVWTDIGTSVASSRGIVTFIDADGGKFPQRFYRTVAP